jgi:hypothetical protein
VWGIGLGPTHDDAVHPAQWRGLNLLGFALMDVRERLAPVAPTGSPMSVTPAAGRRRRRERS